MHSPTTETTTEIVSHLARAQTLVDELRTAGHTRIRFAVASDDLNDIVYRLVVTDVAEAWGDLLASGDLENLEPTKTLVIGIGHHPSWMADVVANSTKVVWSYDWLAHGVPKP